MKTMMKMLMVLLSTLPCGLICADGMALNAIGIVYTGVWMWAAYEVIKAYEQRKGSAQADR